MTPNERYERLWLQFLFELNKKPDLTLASFLKKQDVHPGSMRQWVEDRGLSVKKAKSVIQFCRETLFQDSTPSGNDVIYLPMTVVDSTAAPAPSNLMQGITLTFPDGTVASVSRATPDALHSLIKMYREGVGL